MISKIPPTTQLWRYDKLRDNGWRWHRVFRFEHVKTIRSSIPMKKLDKIEKVRKFLLAVTEAFCYNKSREITLREYRNLLELFIS